MTKFVFTRDELEKEKASLIEQRDSFMQDANLRLATMNGRIAQLDELLAQEYKPTDTEPIEAEEAEA